MPEWPEPHLRGSAFRVEVSYIGDEPTPCYWAAYSTDPDGQWFLLADEAAGPFDRPSESLVRLAELFLRWHRRL